uniref:RNA polymerase sigma factor n=1 Tax=Pedobacter schmidteae TaxID=2201271 RepID=UPI000EAC45FD|nr:RNA polymerase sigma factor [Pedobacter schmidteae]
MSDYSKYSDQDLIHHFKNGDEAAFAEIYQRNYILLFNHASRMTQNLQAAEDLVHDTFLIFIEQKATLDEKSSPRYLLFTILQRKIINRFRKIGIEKKFLENKYVTSSVDETDLINEIIKNEEEEMLREGIYRLPKEMRKVYLLKNYSDLSRSEIAKFLGVSENTVKTQIQLGKDYLKRIIGKLLFFIF